MKEINLLIREVLNAAIHVHKQLGPGLLESVYEICLCKEFSKRGIQFTNQVAIYVVYEGEPLEQYFKIDILVENRLVLEIKSVEFVLPVHEAQVITYLKLSGIETGLLINFNTLLLKNGIKRLFKTKSNANTND